MKHYSVFTQNNNITFVTELILKSFIMKKKMLFVAAILGASFGTIAQDQSTDKVFTPEAGDWVIGFDAAPILNYAGNMFNGSTGNSLGSDFVNSDNVLFGKYYKDATTAYRGSLRILNYSVKQDILNDTSTVSYIPSYLTDVTKQSGSLIQIGAGLEKRKGDGRFQGGATNSSTEYSTALTLDNIANGSASNFRTLSSNTAGGFGLSIRGFAGVEYFILPKISLGAEFGWGFGMQTTGEAETVTEIYDFVDAAATAATTFELTTMTSKSSIMAIDTDNMQGRIKLLFHF
jgi:hypothetical protein